MTGYDVIVIGGGLVGGAIAWGTSVAVPVLRDIAARNLAVFPCLTEASVVRVWSALRVMTPDGFPIYQQSETCPGACATTCHSGVTLVGAHALDLAPAILAGQLPGKFDAFSSARFRVPSAEFARSTF